MAELGRGPKEPQQMGATLPVHSRRWENLRMVASMVGWVVTEVTVNLHDAKLILIHLTKSKLLCSLTFLNLPHLSRILLKKIVLSCNDAETSAFNWIGAVAYAG